VSSFLIAAEHTSVFNVRTYKNLRDWGQHDVGTYREKCLRTHIGTKCSLCFGVGEPTFEFCRSTLNTSCKKGNVTDISRRKVSTKQSERESRRGPRPVNSNPRSRKWRQLLWCRWREKIHPNLWYLPKKKVLNSSLKMVATGSSDAVATIYSASHMCTQPQTCNNSGTCKNKT
jgi:hypothetical protein